MERKLINVKELAEMLRISKFTVYNNLSKYPERLPKPTRIGKKVLFDLKDVDNFFEMNKNDRKL